MPVVLVTTGPDRTENLLKIVNDVRLMIGLPPNATTVLRQAGAEDATLLTVICVNEIQQRLFDRCGRPNSVANALTRLVPGMASYELPSGLVKMMSDPSIADAQLSETTIDELRAEGFDLEELGDPTHYYLGNATISLYPVPSGVFMRDKLVYEDLGWYIATRDHVAGEDGTGSPTADSESWVQIEDPTETLDGADYAWEAGKRYYSGYLDIHYIRGLTLLVDNADIPVLGAEFYPALKAGAAWRVQAIRGIGDPLTAERIFAELERDRIKARRRGQSNPRERFSEAERA